MKRTSASVLGIVACLFALAMTRSARASDLPPFGQRGQFVFDDLIGFRFGQPGYLGQLRAASEVPTDLNGVTSVGEGGVFGYAHVSAAHEYEVQSGVGKTVPTTTNSFWFAPAGDYFVGRHLSIGAALGVLYERTDWAGNASTERSVEILLSIAPRVGYVVEITDRLAFWPRLTVGYTEGRSTVGFGGDRIENGESIQTGFIGVEGGIVYRVTPHWMVHLEPGLVATDSISTTPVGHTRDFSIGAAGAMSIAAVL